MSLCWPVLPVGALLASPLVVGGCPLLSKALRLVVMHLLTQPGPPSVGVAYPSLWKVLPLVAGVCRHPEVPHAGAEVCHHPDVPHAGAGVCRHPVVPHAGVEVCHHPEVSHAVAEVCHHPVPEDEAAEAFRPRHQTYS